MCLLAESESKDGTPHIRLIACSFINDVKKRISIHSDNLIAYLDSIPGSLQYGFGINHFRAKDQDAVAALQDGKAEAVQLEKLRADVASSKMYPLLKEHRTNWKDLPCD